MTARLSLTGFGMTNLWVGNFEFESGGFFYSDFKHLKIPSV
jgi:hypothetical protein